MRSIFTSMYMKQITPTVLESHLRGLDPEDRQCLYANEASHMDGAELFVLLNHFSRHRQLVDIFQNYSQSGCTFECMAQAGFINAASSSSACNTVWNQPANGSAVITKQKSVRRGGGASWMILHCKRLKQNFDARPEWSRLVEWPLPHTQKMRLF